MDNPYPLATQKPQPNPIQSPKRSETNKKEENGKRKKSSFREEQKKIYLLKLTERCRRILATVHSNVKETEASKLMTSYESPVSKTLYIFCLFFIYTRALELFLLKLGRAGVFYKFFYHYLVNKQVDLVRGKGGHIVFKEIQYLFSFFPSSALYRNLKSPFQILHVAIAHVLIGHTGL